MSAVVFEPHADDAALFCAFTVQRLRPTIVTVLGQSVVQGQDPSVRLQEASCAAEVLGTERWVAWKFSDAEPDWDGVEAAMVQYDIDNTPREVWVPWPEEHDGHEHHDMTSIVAGRAFGPARLRFYGTYRRGSHRTQLALTVNPLDNELDIKRAAMDCFASQIALESTRPWFESGWEREWVC